MRHIWGGVEQSMNAMSTVTPYYTVTMRLYVFLDDVTNLTEAFARFNDLDGLAQCFVCDLHQILVFFRHITYEERFVQVTMEFTMVNRNVHVAQIAILRNMAPFCF